MKKYYYVVISSVCLLVVASVVIVANPAMAQDYVFLPLFDFQSKKLDVDASAADSVERISVEQVDIGQPTTPEPEEIEELKKFAKKEKPRKEVIVHVSGPETRGREVMWPGANRNDRVLLPPDAWVSFWGPSECHGDDCENGIYVAVKRDSTNDVLWTLNGRVKLPDEVNAASASQIYSDFHDIIIQLEPEMEVSK